MGYTNLDILSMEAFVLTVLEFSIGRPTAANFMQRYQRANDCGERHGHLVHYILELALMDAVTTSCLPSQLASAATLLSNILYGQDPIWPSAMVSCTGHTEVELLECAT